MLRAHYEDGKSRDLEIVAVNTPGDDEINAHLLRYDTVHGRFAAEVKTEGPDWMTVNGDRIRMFSTRDPKEIPWGELDVDVVLECTGAFTHKDKAMMHIEQGAKKVLISAPGKEVDATVVYGVNDSILTSAMQVVSNASCTTNCLAPLAKALNDTVGIERGLMTTIHSYTNDQNVTDVYHKDMRRARAAAMVDDSHQDRGCEGRGPCAAGIKRPFGRLRGARAHDQCEFCRPHLYRQDRNERGSRQSDHA